MKKIKTFCFVDRASRDVRAKKNQLDAQFIFSLFRQKEPMGGGVESCAEVAGGEN